MSEETVNGTPEVTFSGNITQNQIETPKSSQGVFELPCGFIDSSGVLHREAHLREMSGREEDLLASPKMTPQKKINALLAACTERIGSIVDRGQIQAVIPSLTQGDRVFVLVSLRRTTLGDELPMEEECPECKVKGNYIADLGSLDVKPLADPMKRVFDLTLPSGKTARFRLGNGNDEERIAKVADDEKPSMAFLCRLELLDGKPPSLMAVKSLGWRDRQELRAAMEEQDGGLDSALDLTCPACGHDFQRDLDLGAQGFFFPARTQKGWKKRSST